MKIETFIEHWPLAKTFRISREARDTAKVIRVQLKSRSMMGQGECVPQTRYGESLESVQQQIHDIASQLRDDLLPDSLQNMLPAGAARNAVDCALWDLLAKKNKKRIWELLGITLNRCYTAYTLSIDTPENMAREAKTERGRPLLKLKLDGEQVLERVQAVRAANDTARLIVDANEAWTADFLVNILPDLKKLSVELVEQPLPAADDAVLGKIEHVLPLGADESCHLSNDLEKLATRYDVINIKLDKTGGLTEALRLKARAQRMGFRIMIGCMVGTSLAMAPAWLLAHDTEFVDLDGPLLLARDREHGMKYSLKNINPPVPLLWG